MNRRVETISNAAYSGIAGKERLGYQSAHYFRIGWIHTPLRQRYSQDSVALPANE